MFCLVFKVHFVASSLGDFYIITNLTTLVNSFYNIISKKKNKTLFFIKIPFISSIFLLDQSSTNNRDILIKRQLLSSKSNSNADSISGAYTF